MLLIVHQAFFAGDKRFYIRGVDYQPGTLRKKKDVHCLLTIGKKVEKVV
jgi:hypothetical protein